MLSFLYVYSDHSILECYNLFSGVELSMRSFFVIFAMVSDVYLRCIPQMYTSYHGNQSEILVTGLF